MINRTSNGEKRIINPGVAAVLSFLYNGLGQLYNGQIKKGLLIISLSSGGMISTLVGAILIGHYFLTNLAFRLELVWGLVLLLAGIALIGCVGTYSIFDAYNNAKRKLNE